MNSLISLGLAIGFFAVVTIVAAVLATHDTRRTVLALVLLGLLAAALKIFLFQQAPQWHDTNPDSITYDLNAQAFAAHWRGQVIDVRTHNRLHGLLDHYTYGTHSAEWVPDDWLAYSQVIGSHEWLYTGYIALWYWLSEATQTLVIWSNALWAAFFPAAAFGIAHSLGASRRVSLAAAGLALLDPSTGVNASALLKDTLAGFLAMAAIWALLAYLREGGKARLGVAVLTLGGLGGVRFVAFLALVIAAGLISVWLLVCEKRRSRGLAIVGIVFSAWLVDGLIAQAPHFFNNTTVDLTAPARAVSGTINLLRSKPGDVSTDETVLKWRHDLADNPVYAIVRSVAHTLFAPYPWVAISPGLNWVSFSELYYPGVVLWILCLPGIFAALARGLRQRELGFWLLALFLFAIVAAYTIWLGEWSTRQRVFALPALFALAAIGWAQLITRILRRRPASDSAHKS